MIPFTITRQPSDDRISPPASDTISVVAPRSGSGERRCELSVVEVTLGNPSLAIAFVSGWQGETRSFKEVNMRQINCQIVLIVG